MSSRFTNSVLSTPFSHRRPTTESNRLQTYLPIERVRKSKQGCGLTDLPKVVLRLSSPSLRSPVFIRTPRELRSMSVQFRHTSFLMSNFYTRLSYTPSLVFHRLCVTLSTFEPTSGKKVRITISNSLTWWRGDRTSLSTTGSKH